MKNFQQLKKQAPDAECNQKEFSDLASSMRKFRDKIKFAMDESDTWARSALESVRIQIESTTKQVEGFVPLPSLYLSPDDPWT
jgi:hypothetical protein